ncbi:hypothetical protein [Streptomyces tibetensis]|uniref:hypothetical protein n=1 Tax=Streptomyces tibetensis TaxID=2382123 RepID=UPI0033E14178
MTSSKTQKTPNTSNTSDTPGPATVATSPTLSATEITTPRLRLRKAHDSDRAGFIELQTAPQVRLHLGGPRPRAAVEPEQTLVVAALHSFQA